MRHLWYVCGLFVFVLNTSCQLRLTRDVGILSEATSTATSANLALPTLSPSTKTIMVGNSATFTAASGVEPYSFSVVSGGGSISSSGLYTASGTPGSVVIRITDSTGLTADATITVVESLQLTPSVASLAVAQDQQFSVIGGVPPMSFGLDSGSPGSVDLAGLFTRPWQTGSSTVRVTDVLGNTASATITLPPGTVQFLPGITKTSSVTKLLKDASGNIFLFGRTTGTIGTQYGTHGTDDAWVAKISPNGSLIWVSQIGPGAGKNMTGWDLGFGAIDSSGNPYFAGTTTGTLGGTQYGTHGSYDGYVVKLNASTGAVLWASQIGDAAGPFYVYRITNDSAGNTYIGGRSGGIIGTQIGTHGSRDHGIVKFDSSGNKVWAIQLGAGAGVTVNAGWYGDLVVDNSGNVYANAYESDGTFSGVAGFLQVGTHSLGQDAYVWKINSSGTHQWVAQLGGGATSYNNPGSIYLEADQSGAYNLYISGRTTGTPGTQIGTHGNTDAYIWSLTSAGANRWVKQLGGGGTTVTSGGALGFSKMSTYLDSSNNIYVVGTTSGTLGGTQVGTHGTGTDTYVWKLNSAGTHQWVTQMGGGGANGIFPADNIAFETSGSILVAGTTPVSLGGTQYGILGAKDIFLWKISSAGAHQRVTQWGGGASSTADTIYVGSWYLDASTGNTYLWGTSTGTQGVTQYGTHGATDALVMKFDSTGAITASQLGGGGSSVFTPEDLNLVESSGNLFIYSNLTVGGSLEGAKYGTTTGGDVSAIVKWNSSLQQQ